jgi:hypothetical protein
MDDWNTAGTEPICTVCSEPVHDDSERSFIRAPGSGEERAETEILYHHRACERDGRLFLTPS